MTRTQEKPPAGVERGGRSSEGADCTQSGLPPYCILYSASAAAAVRGHSPVSFSSSHTSASPREKGVENPVDNLWKGRGKNYGRHSPTGRKVYPPLSPSSSPGFPRLVHSPEPTFFVHTPAVHTLCTSPAPRRPTALRSASSARPRPVDKRALRCGPDGDNFPAKLFARKVSTVSTAYHQQYRYLLFLYPLIYRNPMFI